MCFKYIGQLIFNAKEVTAVLYTCNTELFELSKLLNQTESILKNLIPSCARF